MSQGFRLQKIDETRNYYLEEIKQIELMNRKYEKVCTTLNYIENVLILASAITGCISVSAFASFLLLTSIGITISVIKLKTGAIAAKIKKYKLTIKKRKQKHEKIVLLAKSRLNSIKDLISKTLIDWIISLMLNLF